MKSITNICVLFLFVLSSFLCSAQTPPGSQKLNLVVSNVCDYYGQYIINNDPSTSGIPPLLGNAGCVYASNYVQIDSLQALNRVKYLDVTDDSPNPDRQKLFYVAGDNQMLSFYSSFPVSWCDPVIVPRDTFLIDSIAGIDANVNRLYVIRSTAQNNLLLYDTLSTTPITSITVAMTPKFMDVNYIYLAVVGIDGNNNVRLNIFNTNTMSLIEDTVLGTMADNPISLLFAGQQLVYLASQPGDSILNMTKYNRQNNSITASTIYSYSGAHAFDWDGSYFHFQPEEDSTGNNFDTHIYKYDLYNMQQYAVYNLGLRFHKLIYAGGGGFSYYAFMHGVIESALNGKVMIYTNFNYSLVDSFQTTYQVDLIASDFRCPVSLEEYDDSKVKILAYPNPTSNSITINASGLICGRDYKMDLIDMHGKIWYQKTIHAKMSIEIPIETMPSGVYILRIHTLKGMVTEKIVKEG
ncbi:MAG: T9SS type A sorting domain-containing protein [Bacteroidetes bacterium]|nr:T9SS type A sorting domain-containing protein [Bacteroidota bacterium]